MTRQPADQTRHHQPRTPGRADWASWRGGRTGLAGRGTEAAGSMENGKVRVQEEALAGHASVVVARFLLGAAAAGGADARQLAKDAGLPPWTFSAVQAALPTWHSTLLWE